MGDFVKIAAKTILIVGIMAAALALLGGIVIPTVNVTVLAQAVGHGKAIIDYYLTGGFGVLFTAGVTLMIIKYIITPLFWLASIVWRWIMKVNE